jgi:hypothetical protein
LRLDWRSGFSDALESDLASGTPKPPIAFAWRVGDPQMRRLTGWFRRFFGSGIQEPRDGTLPFTAEEFARLISSGKSEDMKRLAERLSRSAVHAGLEA